MEKKTDALNFHKHRVFDRDPFAVDPLPKAHYYPSPERKVRAKQKCIVGKAPLEKRNEQQNTDDRLSPMDELFLKGSNFYQSQDIDPTSQVADDINFDESWPASERPSSLSLSGLEDDGPFDIQGYQETLNKFTDLKKTLDFRDKENQVSSKQQRLRKPGSSSQTAGIGKGKKADKYGTSKTPVKSSMGVKKARQGVNKTDSQAAEGGQGSVLSRYIDRFRNSAPMSREQRDKQERGSANDFWWMSNKEQGIQPSGSSAPREDTLDGLERREITPLTEENLDRYSSIEGLKKFGANRWNDSPDHKRTVDLQERAEKLLEKSSSTIISTDPAVSTEGLGSNMSDMSSLDEYPYKPSFAKYAENMDKEVFPKYSRQEKGFGGAQLRVVHPNRPDEDILYQWRLRRRMDEAKEATPANVGSFGFLTKTEQQKKIDSKLEEFKQKLSGKEPKVQSTRTQLGSSSSAVDQPIVGPHDEPIVPPPSTGRVQFTPTPTYSQKDNCDMKTKVINPEIASPTLHRHKLKSQHNQQPVDPHLHLMCDLLPCPHQQEYIDQYSVDDRDGQCKPSNNTQYLQAEKPDIEERSAEKGSEIHEYRDNSRVEELKEIKHSVVDKEASKPSRDRSNKKRTVVNHDESVNKQNVSCGDKRNKHSQGLEEHLHGDKSHVSKEEGRNNVIKPTHSSSPKTGRRTLDSAIGQAIKDHLFSTTTSTVLSSVDSLPPTVSVERLDKRHTTKVRQADHTDVQYESDGEYSEDHLLQMLRKQRSFFEMQLQQIDDKLKSIDDT